LVFAVTAWSPRVLRETPGSVRIVGTLLTVVGLLLLVSGSLLGCGALFTWNGKHVVETRSLEPEKHVVHTVSPVPGRRYSFAVQVVFARSDAPPAAKLSLVARVVDKSGANLGEAVGWIDPDEPPTVVYGTHAPHEKGDLVAERVFGAFHATARDPVEVRVDLGADRTGTSRILDRRLVVYDDVTPAPIARALWGAAAGGVLFTAGLAVLFGSFFRGRSRRGGIRPR
jgi:hypothetical protein